MKTFAVPRAVPVHIIARVSFAILYYLSLTNILLVVSLYNKRTDDQVLEIPAYPIAFGILGGLVLLFTGSRRGGPLLTMSWVVAFVFIIGGFAGKNQLTGSNLYYIAETTIKPWMTLVGVPWLAVRAVTEDRLPSLMRGTVLVTSILSALGIAQMVFPGFMLYLMQAGTRASATYYNSNHLGFMCVCALFISLICPFKQVSLSWLCRIVLVMGVAVSLSRMAMLALPVAWIVFGVASGRISTLLKSLGLGVAAVVLILSSLGIAEATAGPEQAKRFESIRGLFSGDFSEETRQDNRTELWKETIRKVVAGDPVLGLGHGSMFRIAHGLQPHNYYLFVWGNSGILAAMCVIIYHVMFFTEGWKCTQPNVRAGLLALATVFVITSILDHSLVGRPFPGCIIALMILCVLYGRRPLPTRGVPMLARPAMPALAKPRA